MMSSKKRTAATAGIGSSSTSTVDNNLARTPGPNANPRASHAKRQKTEESSTPQSASRYDRFVTSNIEETSQDSIHLHCPITCPLKPKANTPNTQSTYQKRLEEALGVRSRKEHAFNPIPPSNDVSRYEISTKPPSSKRRKIPQEPDRILDAPGLKNDYYINVLDWSALDVIAVGLGSKAYTWEVETSKVTEIMSVPWPDHMSAISFSPTGKNLALASEHGLLHILDFTTKTHTFRLSHREPNNSITALGWSPQNLLALGTRDGSIKIYRIKGSSILPIMTCKRASSSEWRKDPLGLIGHSQRVVAVEFSPDGRTLATGGNDNLVCLWDVNGGGCGEGRPKKVLREHGSAVRAMAWCPWESNVLATGGGLGDRTIRIFNSNSGKCLTSVETGSQVCALVWSKAYKELLSSHSLASDQLVLWNYPSMTKTTTLVGHTVRPLFMALSPDGQTVVTGAGDENLRFWKCFETKPGQKMLKCPSAVLLEEPVPNVFR
ncbi:ubiquitin-protein transferase activating protein [Rhizophlyctis rosea]|uniref:Ubiquitin-protein transferase activating protein n=1 Tax=Rhizophlyctis rosea TaxID=64517 RepID=A0AAD5S6F6_9FUNG|nr:ubiquitin-protein transferase activating protein [Rhizophlyctis rosea]